MNLKGSETEKNLYRTFAGESRARNKYNLYAEKARMDGYQYIGKVFDETAENERAHAREVFNRYLKLNKSTAENLLVASMGESKEATDIYIKFSDIARKEGFKEIADFFKELSEVEENHEKTFDTLHKRVVEGEMFNDEDCTKWRCMNCGYIHIGDEAPMICPLCKYPRSYFKIYEDLYR